MATIFALKERHLGNLGLTEYCWVWVRTMPLWPPKQLYHFAFAHPAEFWDNSNNMFRRSWADQDQRPFVLVFRKDGSNQHSYFMVFLDVVETAQPWGRKQLCCGIKFCRTLNMEVDDIDREGEKLMKQENVKNLGRLERDRVAQDREEEVTLKCYAQLEAMYGRQLFCADIHLKEHESSAV